MTDIWVTVPTAGRATLTAAIDSTGIPREQVVVVATAPDVQIPDGCAFAFDVGPINIQRWWNAGIRTAESYGARYVAVINDDVLMDEHTLPALLAAMIDTGATLASPGEARTITDPSPHLPMSINGACWVLDLSHGVRPDEGYHWWFGDNDLDWQARRCGGIVTVPVTYTHLTPNALTEASRKLQMLTIQDAQRWAQAKEASCSM